MTEKIRQYLGKGRTSEVFLADISQGFYFLLYDILIANLQVYVIEGTIKLLETINFFLKNRKRSFCLNRIYNT